ncbi:hypothetical protein ACTA71_006215 [Dictyostelium dimigraforme]
MNFFDSLKAELQLGEEELNKCTIQIRLYYPNTAELNLNTFKLLDRFIVNGTLNIIRKLKGITVYGRVRNEDFSELHQCYSTFKNIDNSNLQRFILYTPGNHYVHFYTFTKEVVNKINKEMVKDKWKLEPILIDECNVIMLQEIVRYSCIILFNKNDDIAIIKNQIDSIKGNKHPIRAFVSEYSNKEVRDATKKKIIIIIKIEKEPHNQHQPTNLITRYSHQPSKPQ